MRVSVCERDLTVNHKIEIPLSVCVWRGWCVCVGSLKWDHKAEIPLYTMSVSLTEESSQRERHEGGDTKRHKETQTDTQNHRETQRDTGKHKGTQGDTKRHKETQRDTTQDEIGGTQRHT